MVKINEMGPKGFIKYIEQKKVYIFGAGNITENCVDIYFQGKDIQAIIDNSHKLWNTEKKYGDREIKVINVDTFVKEILCEEIEDIVLLIAPTFHTAEIIQQLNEIEQLNGLNCFLHRKIRNTKEESKEFSFSKGTPQIPKIIHYIWVGGNPLPKEFKKNIQTWKEKNPEYEIIRWDESNYDFSKNEYMREAYENKAWGFVPDYARLDIIYKYGGIYLDTDVEVIKNLDVLLCDDAYFGFGSGDRINLGIGFGAIPNNFLIKEMRDYYNDKRFIDAAGKQNRIPCYHYQHPILKKYGFQIVNDYQKNGNTVVYPAEVLSPLGTAGEGDFFSDKTLTIHYGAGTWLSESEKNQKKIPIME